MKRDDEIKARMAELKQGAEGCSVFVAELERKLDVLEKVRNDFQQLRRINRKRLWAAGLAGFFVGVLFASLIPILEPRLSMLFSHVIISENASVAALTVLWLTTALMTVLSSFAAYRLVPANMMASKGRNEENLFR